MEGVQDGGQQNMKSDHDYPPQIEGSRINSEMNNFTHSSGEGPESFTKMSEGMHMSQMPNYPGYSRGSFGISEQHGGMTGPRSGDFCNQNAQFSGHFPHNPVRSSYPVMSRSGMSPVRAGQMPPDVGMPGSYTSSQRIMSSQSQNGPTPTLNQLLQTSSSGQRFPGNYTDFTSQGKSIEMGGAAAYSLAQQGWNGNPRSMSFPQGPSMGGAPYKSQGNSMSESRLPSGMSSGQGPGAGYPYQGQYMNPAMAASAQRYMAGQARSGHMPPMSSHGYSQQMPPHSLSYSPSMSTQPSQLASLQQQQQQQHMYHHGQQQQPQPPGQPSSSQPSPIPSQQQQVAVAAAAASSTLPSSSSLQPPSSHSQGSSPTQASPASQGMAEQTLNQTSVNMKKSEEITEPTGENCLGDDHRREQGGNERCPSTGSQSQLGVGGGVRLVPSPAGSTGSRSDTPASNSGAQVHSPMPPRPPSSQGENQNHTSPSPMATQGYNQPMMPPPVPGQMGGYPGGAGGKMGGPGMGGTPVPPHFPQYASQYSQGGYRSQPGMGGMQGPGGGYPQAMYNGPNSQMGPGGPTMYNSMMSRNMQNYNTPYGPNASLPMNSHYGNFNSHMVPGQGPGPGPGPGSGPSPVQSGAGPMPMGPGQMMGGQAGMNSGGPPGIGMAPGGKNAQAAAQAAVIAAASSAGTRMPGRAMPMSPRMMGPQGNGPTSPGMMNHMGNLGNPSLASMSNQIQQITSSSVTGLGKPSSPAGSCPGIPPNSTNSTSTLVDNAGPSTGTAGQSSISGGGSGESTNLMSPLSGSDTQESSSRPSSTATPGQPVDAAGNSVSDLVGCEGSGSVPGSDSTSVDSGFHSAADHSEKPPSESISTQASSPPNPIPPPPASGQSEEEASQDSLCKILSNTSASIPTGLHSSTTTTTVTNASVDMTLTQSVSASGSQSAGSQTSASMPLTKPATSSSPATTSIPNGPHYPHPHPHHMGYQMGPRGGPSPMGAGYPMMGGYGTHHHHHHHHPHHPGMHPMGSMAPYGMPSNSMGPGTMPSTAGMRGASGMPGNMPGNMPPGNVPSNMATGNMPSNMAPGNMPSNVPPGNMPSNMPPGNMPSNMPPGNMPSSMASGNMPSSMAPGNMPGSMASGNMPSNMPPGNMPSSMASGNMPSNMAPGNMPGSMAPGNMPSNMPNSMAPGNMPEKMSPRNMSSNMPPGSMPNHMPPANLPSGNMPPGSMPPNSISSSTVPPGSSMPHSHSMANNMPPGNMPGSMHPGNTPDMSTGNMPPGNMSTGNMPNMSTGNMATGNMSSSIPPGNMPPGNMPNSMHPGNMPNMHPGNMPNMSQGNMPNNMPPGSGGSVPSSLHHGTMAPGSGSKSSMNRVGGMPNHMQSSGGSAAMPNNLPPGVAPNHTMPPHGVMSGLGSQPRPGMGDMNNHSAGPPGVMMPQKNFGPPPSAMPEDLPVPVPEKKKKKASDVTRLYDMGNERDRRPFLDRLFAFLDEIGKPLTVMPTISKQALDLFTLYHCVREKGGMVEVNKGKRWKEICSVVNIGTSASAAFTLKKNYIRYLFAFECKYDLGGLDPAPILQEMESHTERKRDTKKRVPSPGSQSSQDGFQQPPTPNSQMMDGYPGGPGGMPPPYMQGPDGQMIPTGMGGHGPGMMMPNNMMGHPGMMPHHPMGHGSSGMMNSGMPGMGPGQSMMSGSMGPQGGMMNSGGSMMGPGGMMGPGMPMAGPNSYSGGPPNSMMGSGSSSSSMGPSPGPPMMAGSSSSGTNTAPSPVPGMAPPTSNGPSLPPPSSTPNSRPATADSISVQDPFADEPSKVSSPAVFQHRAGGPTPSPTPGGFPSPGPPTTSGASGFGSRPSSASNPNAAAFPASPANEQGPGGFRRSSETFQANSVGMFPGRSEGARFPFGPESSSHAGQPYRPGSDSSEPSFTPRFPGQQPPFPSGGPGEAFSGSHPFPGQSSGYGPRMPGQEHFSSFPGVRPPMSHEGSFSGPGREGASWSPMHAQRAFPASSGTPDTALGGPFGRPHQRGSPHTRDKVLSKLQQKGGAMHHHPHGPFSPKKEIDFPADSVEAVQPTLSKRRRLTHKDLAPVEAWRLMMALKSGLLAESTWAIDTLNVLLFDDATVTYFSLTHMPGLLEVLTEHLRASLIHAFSILRDRELWSSRSSSKGCRCKGKEQVSEGDSDKNRGDDDELVELIKMESEAHVDPELYCSNYTWISRQGKAVAKEDDPTDCAVMDSKHWDIFSKFTSGKQHWQKGGGDITVHVAPCFESSVTHTLLTDLFCARRTSKEKEMKQEGQKRKAANNEDNVFGEDCHCSNCQGGSEKRCGKICSHAMKRLKDCSEDERVRVGGSVVEKHSNVGSLKEQKNHVISKVEIKEEVQEAELHRCESDDSLPPPVLPAATQDGPVSCEEGSGEESMIASNNSQSNGSEEKTMPPDLTCEKVDGEENKTKNEKVEEETKMKNETPSEADETETKAHEEQTKEEIQSSMEKSDDEMTAEIVAMMTKEQDQEMEEEAYRHDDAPLTIVQSDQEEMGRRCVAISNIFRSLSCIPGNESLLSKHQGFMLVVGQLLMLHHWHPPRSKAKPAPPLPSEHDDVPIMEIKKEAETADEEEKDWATSPEWWWDMLESVRENALVVLANISSHMHMSDMDSDVCLPILDGLLHWMVCPSSVACDPFPSAPSASQLSPQRLAMEALCKLCIHGDNVDLLLATPPFSRILLLLGRLMNFLSDRNQQVPREFSIVLLSRLVQADAVAARAIALQHPSISLLLEFLESAEQSAMAAASQQRGSVACNNPEVLGTSLDMLCRAASTLLHIARVPDNRKLFLHHQSRLLALVMSQILDTGVTRIISDVLFECSQSDLSPS